MTTVASTEVQVTVGVDTHADVHVAAALDQLGRLLATQSVPTTPAGYRTLVAWAGNLGTLDRFGVEGTGSYGAGSPVGSADVVSKCWRLSGPSVRIGVAVESQMRLMPKPLHAPCRLERRPPSPKLEMARSRCCASSRQLADRPSRPARRLSISCTPSSLPRRIACAHAYAG